MTPTLDEILFDDFAARRAMAEYDFFPQPRPLPDRAARLADPLSLPQRVGLFLSGILFGAAGSVGLLKIFPL